MSDTRRKRSHALPILTVLALTSGVRAAEAQAITAFAIPNRAVAIAAGPDGNLWFTESRGRNIGRMTTSGVVTEFAIPTAGATTSGITAGPDGNLWFTEYLFSDEMRYVAKIGRITTAGEITEFAIPTFSEPSTIVTGSGGSLWIASSREGKIGRFSTTGKVTEFATAGVRRIARGPDGNLWFTANSTITSHIGRVTTAGVVSTFAVPGFPSRGVSGIASGPDGKLWFTEQDANKIGRITTSGEITEFAIPTPDSGPSDIVAGSDGNLWFTQERGNRIGRITTEGVISEFGLRRNDGSGPMAIVAGPDGNLWFTESSANRIGRITTTGTCLTDEHSLCLSGGRFRATASYRSSFESEPALATGLSDSGFFTFDNPDSVELVVKVLDACSFSRSVWVFAAGLTDQEVTLTVTDTETEEVRTYFSPLGTTFVTITDTAAFTGACP